jgi:hypothetical protein
MTNTPDLPSLTTEERTYVDLALEAMQSLKKTFEFWMAIAQGLKALRDRADAIGGRFTFDRLREREGLGPGTINKTRVSRLLAILAHRDEVEAWRALLASNKQFDWQSPESVWNKCPIFHEPKEDPKTEPRPSPMAKLKLANQEMQEENFQLKERLKRADGNALSSLAVDEIMEILTGSMDQTKGKELASRLSEFYSQAPQNGGASKAKSGAERTRKWREAKKAAGEQAAQES